MPGMRVKKWAFKTVNNVRRMSVIIILVMGVLSGCCFGLICGFKAENVYAAEISDYDFSDADKAYEELVNGNDNLTEQSFGELVEQIIGGDYSSKGIVQTIWQVLFGVLANNKKALVQIVILAVLSALINSFLPVINSGQVSDMAQMIIKIVLVTILMASFTGACNVCVNTLNNCITMYEAIVPVFFTIVVATSGSITGAAYYEVILIMITIINSIFKNVLVNLARIYILFSIADMITGKEQFSKMCELLEGIIKWSCKITMTVFSGIGCIKGLINPISDAYKKNMLYKSLKLVPVVGGSMEAVSQTIVGAGTVIKNGVGVAAIIALVAVCAVPVIKLTVLTVLYKVTAACIEPVADKNFVKVVSSAGSAIGLLTIITVMTVAMFILMTAIICIATNVNM